MKPIGGVIITTLLFLPWADASTLCAPGTLSSYETLGPDGCTIGTNTFSDFNTLSGISGSTPIPAASIEVAPSGNSGSPSLAFTISATASNGQILEALFNYTVSGNVYSSVSIAASGTSSSGNGVVTAIQNYCVGGSFGSTGVTTCTSGIAGNLLVLGDGNDFTSIKPAASLSVTDDFTFDSGGPGANNSAAGGTLTNSYAATAVVVPEPSTYILIFAAFLSIPLLKPIYTSGQGER